MNDRELLEMDAKAAGYEVEFDHKGIAHIHEGSGNQSWSQWNPLNDDGDAFRLAVKLSINVSFASIPTFGDIYAQAPDVPPVFEHVGGDVFAATRRAIVLSAANIGRNMK